ncbi:hypothetical protein FisN_18Lh154 [Fistulifera solaris]|uniref:Transcription initiation factor IIF subunit alpha n=1 Tax=Fistulifera solaris TaxID=1519565 RepID=A0A1Z5JTZ8_FISSO|nr:hypothetical protein FisN_18Lh154 [Fistulifera solaris]|eukprot:GAX17513.1 hypothetical protein FisN_18Lh154 [Fistulifera solaris]
MAPKRGIDALFSQVGKSLPTGGSLSFRLVKGPATVAVSDPVDPKAPPQEFPLLAKFPESVIRPDFTKHPWNSGRLYQQEVPRPLDDEEDEEDHQQQKKKRWKYNRNHTAQRQWILQEEVDFLETMVAKREKRETKKLSSRYEGVPEHNASQYVIFFASENNAFSNHEDASDDQPTALLQVRTLPSPLGTIPFAQPAVRHSYSLAEAENAIQDQRMGIRTLRPDEFGDAQPVLRIRKTEVGSKSRLLDKLKAKSANDDVEEGDDVMGDVAYRNRKSGGARRELLQDIGEGILVSEDGVLGGANDAVFGGKERFGELKAEKIATDEQPPGDTDNGNTERGADGAAMADDFYTRDVKAEYDELDYDANEQFDDDDVDLGESEMITDEGGFGDDDDEADALDDDEDEQAEVAGAEGLASAAGFKMMLAKARGELPQLVTAADLRSDAANSRGDKDAGVDADDHISKIMKAAEKAAAEAGHKISQEPQISAASSAAPAASIQVDENGFRIISLDAVRREIWLNHGQIPMKRLMKIFDIKKKSTAERQAKFREMVKELCTMVNDPVSGRMLVLKQHYSNMK